MTESFHLEIISPEQTLIKSEVKQVVVPAFEGLMTFLKDHIPLVTFLRPGFIEVETSGSNEKFYVEEGTVEFSKNQLLILSSTAINKKNFTLEIAKKMIEKSSEKLANAELKDKEKYILSYKIETLREIS